MTLEAIRYRAGSLQILNQLLLPRETVYEEIRSVQDGYEAIKSMKVGKISKSSFTSLRLPFYLFVFVFICSQSACFLFPPLSLHETVREER